MVRNEVVGGVHSTNQTKLGRTKNELNRTVRANIWPAHIGLSVDYG